MNTEDAFTAKIYDPLLYFAMRNIRRDVVRLIRNRSLRILDLCCGTGDQLKKLSDAGFCNLTGVDLSPEMLKVAQKGGKIAHLMEGDAQHTGLPDATFDIIIISFAIHDKPIEMQHNLVAEAHRLLAPEGQLILIDFSLDDQVKPIGKIGVTAVERLAGSEHYRNFKSYVATGGMAPVVQNRFKSIQQVRHAFGAVSIWVMIKPDV